MGLVAFCGTPVTLVYFGDLARIESLALQTKAGQATLERINGLVYAVVMDARGINMSATKEKAKPFGDGMLRNLKLLEQSAHKLSEQALDIETDAVIAARQHVDSFIVFRTEMVRLSQEESPAAARVQGDNDANRNNRVALNGSLKGLSDRYSKHALENVAQAEQLRAQIVKIVLLLGGLPVVATMLGVVVIITGFTRPIDRITTSIMALAGGDTQHHVFGSIVGTRLARSPGHCRSSRATCWRPSNCDRRPRTIASAAKPRSAGHRRRQFEMSAASSPIRSASVWRNWLRRI
jgi:methyl-accepting chemotaxis protein